MKDIIERQPPYDTKAEEGLVGSLALNYQQWPKVAHLVTGSDFYDDQLGKAFDALVLLSQAGKRLDDALVLRTEFAALGVASVELFRLLRDACHPEVSRYYAERVRKLANHRRLIAIATSLLNDAFDATADEGELATRAKAAIETIETGGPQRPESFGEVAERVMENLRKPDERREGGPVMTGLPKVDSMAGAMRPGEFIVIAARPGIGKTALAMQIAAHNADRDRRSLFVTLEMTADELVTRTLASRADVSSTVIRNGLITEQQIDKIGVAAVDNYSLPIQIWAPPKASMVAIEATAKVTAAQPGGLALLVVDYIGLVEPANKRDDRAEQVAKISKAMKRLSKELQVPIIGLCQLNREADKIEVPRLGNLAESSGIEKDADMVWFIHMPGGRQSFEPDGTLKTNILIAKHRHGSTGNVELFFDPPSTKFIDHGHEWRPSP